MQSEANLLNSLTSSQNPATMQDTQSTQQNTEPTGFDKLAMQAENIITQFESLSRLYEGGEEEAREVYNAIAKWLAKTSGNLNIPSNGGNATGIGTTPNY